MSSRICPQCSTRYGADQRFCSLDGATLVAEQSSDTLSGSVLADRYHVREKLGEGGMGEVYLAEHVRMKRKVAVKVMRKWLTSDAAAIGRFHREAENASQISHPNVAAVYDFGETSQGVVYLAMEYVAGESLTRILDREQTLNNIRAADIVSQVADALGAAHALGILHRDLKPDNVMIGKTRVGTDQVKLLDFGIARVMGRETQHFTSTGLIVGTPDWMSPEQISGDQLDARADIYALGLMAFRMLAGAGAFGGGTSQETLLAKMTKPPRRLADVRADIAWPEPLQQALDRALATDPANRYGDALAFASDFYIGVSQLPMSDDAQNYLTALSQRSMTPSRGLGTIESTPAHPVRTLEMTPMPRVSGVTNIDTPVPTASSGAMPGYADESTVRLATPPMQPSGEYVKPAVTTEVEVGSANVSGVSAAVPGIAVPGIAAPGIAVPGIAAPGIAVPGIAAPGIAAPGIATPEAASTRRRNSILIGVGAAALVATVVIAVMQRSSGAGTVASAPLGDTLTVGDTTQAAGPAPAPTDSVSPAGPVSAVPALVSLDTSAARARSSVFSIVGSRARGSGFLADSSGIVLTAASVVGGDEVVSVFLDPGRRVLAPVVSVDESQGTAAVLIPVRHCPRRCAPLFLAPDSVVARQGDSVVAVGPPALTAPRVQSKGTVTTATARRLVAAVRLGDRGTGAPVLGADGKVVGLARTSERGSATLAAAPAVHAFLTKAQGERARRQLVANDSLPPSWPSTPVSAAAIAEGDRITDQSVATYRVQGNGFSILVMTPQVLAWRKAKADTLRKYFNPTSISDVYCGDGDVCDPLEAWPARSEYMAERRAVVVVQVSPDSAPPPFIGYNRRTVNFRVGDVASAVVTRDGAAILPIETLRISAVPNASKYPTARPAFHSVVYVYSAADWLPPSGSPAFQLNIADAATGRARTPFSVAIPPSVLQAVRQDLGRFVGSR